MKSLFFFIKKLSAHRLSLIAGIVLSIILAICSIALLSLSGWFISAAAFAGLSVTTAAAFNYFIPAASIRFLALMRILSRYFDRVINHDSTFKILATLRVWFYRQLIPLSPAKLLSKRSGDLLNNIVNDIDTLDHLYLNVLSPFIVSIVITLLFTLFINYFSTLLAHVVGVMSIITLTLIPIITYHFGKKIGRDSQEATAAMRVKIVETLQGFLDLSLLMPYEKRLNLLALEQIQLSNIQRKFSLLKGFVIAAVQFLLSITLFLLLFFGIPAVNHHHLSGAELTMITLLLIAAFEQFLALPFAALSLGKAQQAANRLLNIATQKPSVSFPINFSVVTNNEIIFKAVSFTYPHRISPVIDNFNLTIPANTHIGITGVSGCGKTTLMYLLARIWNPTSGELWLGEQPIAQYPETELRKKICFITQHVHIFNASIKDNLTLMQNSISDEACFEVLKKVELADLIYALPEGLNTIMGEFGRNFSGGQVRRLSIARALLTNASILIFDEPSTGLDASLVEKIWRNCESNFKNKTVIVITHDDYLLTRMHTVIAF